LAFPFDAFCKESRSSGTMSSPGNGKSRKLNLNGWLPGLLPMTFKHFEYSSRKRLQSIGDYKVCI
jgi:hypothetical protein